MTKHNRTPLQVSPQFLDKLKGLQKKIRMTTGDEKSLRELTDHIASSGIFNDVEREILSKNNIDIRIRFDRRNFK